MGARGADINAVTRKDHKSALHFAAENGSPSVAKALIEGGIDLDIEWEKGIEKIRKSAYDVAVDGLKHEIVDMISKRKKLLAYKMLERNKKIVENNGNEL